MKKAVPTPARPRNAAPLGVREPWERAIDNYDRSVRRREKKYRQHVIRLDPMWIALISTDRRLPLDRLNSLDPVMDHG
jgi:hypothetical protein